MNLNRNKDKHKGIMKLFYKIKYSLDGLKYSYQNELSLTIHAILTVFLIILGIIFNINALEWIMIITALTLILAFEIFNTAIEIVVDMITKEYSELAKHAKDCASASTFILCIASTIIVLIIFIPKFILLFN